LRPGRLAAAADHELVQQLKAKAQSSVLHKMATSRNSK